MFENIIRQPDIVMIESEMATRNDISAQGYTLNDVCVETISAQGRLEVYVTAQTTPVRRVRLRSRVQALLIPAACPKFRAIRLQ